MSSFGFFRWGVPGDELRRAGRGPARRLPGVLVPAADPGPVVAGLLVEDVSPEKVRLLVNDQAVDAVDGARQEGDVHELDVARLSPGDGRELRVPGMGRAVEAPNEVSETRRLVHAARKLLEHVEQRDDLLRVEALETAGALAGGPLRQGGVVAYLRRDAIALLEDPLVGLDVAAVIRHVAHQGVVQSLREPDSRLPSTVAIRGVAFTKAASEIRTTGEGPSVLSSMSPSRYRGVSSHCEAASD